MSKTVTRNNWFPQCFLFIPMKKREDILNCMLVKTDITTQERSIPPK